MAQAPATTRTTTYRHQVRYFEADQQGVVFNMWYLAYFDEAMSLYLKEGGLPYQKLLDSGHDVQLAHTEIDWRVPLRWPDEAAIVVSLESRGNTSFILRFEVYHDDVLVCRARTVYVVVATDGTGVKAIPEVLDTALP